MGDYDIFYLSPKGLSSLAHRGDVDLRSCLYNLYPLMSSPMPGISGPKLVIEMGKNNCLGILHRFGTPIDRLKAIKEVSKSGVPFGISIALGKDINEFNEIEIPIAITAVELGAVLIVTDCANGYIPQHFDRGKILRDKFPDLALATGNVINKEGAEYLKSCGFDYIRIGIGPGSVCLTRSVTGVGRNQLMAIRDCSPVDAHLISDGGISCSGNAVKSFAAGAEFVFLGGILAESFESEHKGFIFGAASRHNHLANNKSIKSIEGKNMKVKKIRPLKDILDEFLWGIRSACTYLDAQHYTDLQSTADIINVNE